MIEIIKSIDGKVLAALISAITTIIVLILSAVGKWFYSKKSLHYKLKTEYTFEQQKSIKEEISKTKVPLLQAAETLNYRLWNLVAHADEKWLEIPQEKWKEEKHHYIRSSAYRILLLWHWILKAEVSVSAYDSTLSPKEDLLYLKYIKAIKYCLCDRLLLKELGYESAATDNHFYIDDLPEFTSLIIENGEVIDFHVFDKKVIDGTVQLDKVLAFLSAYRKEWNNFTRNQLSVLHLLIVGFLNEFGHEYQNTDKKKVKELVLDKYDGVMITREYKKFLERHKLQKDQAFITKKMTEQVAASDSPKRHAFCSKSRATLTSR
ncbi:hypothetical protein [Pseudoalteromonas sp. BDTF-M6]|uniref:hypothetical protein n=1 Tax=Pseudoalteromonas sp. BDTF-M6 TaxID=2796132 RepID=UPI001BB0B5F9|nr:hypothetical protein [Pseudoalteromonas sp. BDTF-M6]MBS3796524.1 hypothetical protein [Pseudoalteromonas sp. BDTF-M6]